MPAFLEAIKGRRHMYEGSILTRKAAKNSCSFSPSVIFPFRLMPCTFRVTGVS